MIQPIFLSSRDIADLSHRVGLDVLMDGLIDRLEIAFKEFNDESCKIPARDGFHYDHPHIGLVEWMPMMRHNDSIMMKMVGYHPDNPIAHQLPTILSTLAMFDVQTGQLKVLADGTFLTALRTGAASAIASSIFAIPKCRTLGIIGAGAQAMSQLHALSRKFTLERVLVYDKDPAVSGTISRRLAPLKIKGITTSVQPLDYVLKEAEILCIATAVEKNKGPVFKDTASLKDYLHINAVGSDLPGKIEVPLGVLERSYVCPDFLKQALVEGECQQLSTEQVGEELHQLVKAPHSVKSQQERLTIFDSTGFALEDFVVLDFITEIANKYGLGMPLDLCTNPLDPYNPYESVFSFNSKIELDKPSVFH